MTHRLGTRLRRRVIQGIAADIGAVHGKERLLVDIATAALDHPDGRIEDVIFPIAGAAKLRAVIDEHRAKGTLDARIQQAMRSWVYRHKRIESYIGFEHVFCLLACVERLLNPSCFMGFVPVQ